MIAAALAASLIILALILSIRTGYGTVQIELSDPMANVQVSVDGNAIEVAGLKEPLRLTAGEHGLQVTSGGFETFSRSFTVKRGAAGWLRVSMVAKSKPAPWTVTGHGETIASQGAARAGTASPSGGEAKRVAMEMVDVGDPGNAANTVLIEPEGAYYGEVGYRYQIGKYDVTAAQYADFLNAVARADKQGLYDVRMASGPAACGIARSGSVGGYSYAVLADHENFPVNYVSWGSAARFCNWLQNGQPHGEPDPSTTEDGSYELKGARDNPTLMAVSRKADAGCVLPTVSEWYKAAYYKAGGVNAGYWTYPTQSDTMPSNLLSATGRNNSNHFNGRYSDAVKFLTCVGAFSSSPGPYGTFDQGGNVAQWTETRGGGGGGRRTWGGSWNLAARYQSSRTPGAASPDATADVLGFRVANVSPAHVRWKSGPK
jgi:formylglycine-generating enzyme required for sulfatase activity